MRFNLPDGRTVEAAATQGAAPGRGSEGDQVNVLYDPENPTDIRIAGFLGSGQMGGVVMIVIGVMFVLDGRRHRLDLPARRMKPYVIRRLRPSAFVPLLGAAAIVAFVIALRLRRGGSPAARRRASALFEAWRGTLVLRVDAKGVRIGQRPNRRIPQPIVPWTSIHEVALTETDPPEIEVRLKHGAPLPAGRRRARSTIRPGPYVTAPQLRMPAPGRRSVGAGRRRRGLWWGSPQECLKVTGAFASCATYHQGNGCCQSSRPRARRRG